MNRTALTFLAALWMGLVSALSFAAETSVEVRTYPQMLELGEVRMAMRTSPSSSICG